jgi:hypothetical protein
MEFQSGPMRRKRFQGRSAGEPYAAHAPAHQQQAEAEPAPSSWMGMVKERVITPLAWLWGGNTQNPAQLALPPSSRPRSPPASSRCERCLAHPHLDGKAEPHGRPGLGPLDRGEPHLALMRGPPASPEAPLRLGSVPLRGAILH